MASSIVLVINTTRNETKTLVGPSSTPHASVNGLADFLIAATGGMESASIDAFAATGAAPAAASGTVTITNGSIVAADTLTIGGVVLTAVASGATTDQFNIGGTATITGANLVAAIAGDATLGKLVTAVNNAGVVTVTLNEKGLVGNLVQFATSKPAAFALVQPTGGAGGATGTPSTYRLGL